MIRHSNIDPSSSSRTDLDKKYYGNYLGMVVQNNDPEKRGRVKIYVPHITSTIYKNWDEISDKEADRNFKFIGDNIDSDLTKIIDDLKDVLPWAECAAPLAGGSSSGRYNARLKTGSISDSNKYETTQEDPDVIETKYKLNADNIGEKPGHKYEVRNLFLKDAFDNSTISNDGNIQTGVPNKVNKLTQHYAPRTYSNGPKGSFSIPNVGAHVWIFFQGGNHMRPVYFATSFGTEDWKGMYEASDGTHGIDYPGVYENKSDRDDPSYNHNTETYRNKYVINQKGGTLEFINTDNREILKMTHYSGSYKEFNNYTNTELAVNNDQKLVLADQFLTIRGNRNEYVDIDYDLIVRGDYYKKVGTFNKQKYQEWRDKVRMLADIKQLFETKRTAYLEGFLNFQKQSPGQLKSPAGKEGHDECPLCCHSNRSRYWKSNDIGITTLKLPAIWHAGDSVYDMSGYEGTRPEDLTNSDRCLPTGDADIWTWEHHHGGAVDLLGGGPCPICNGDGISPSTQGGTFDNEDKDNKVKEKIQQDIAALALIEREMGLGGSEISHISKHKVETVGLLMNDFPSIRVDEIGKICNNEVRVFPDGVATTMQPSPLVEYVHVDDLPGGSYTINACNRFNVMAGAGGISLKSYGPVDIGGTIMNLAAEQINMSTEGEINIVADKRLNIVSDILSLRQKNYGQVLVDCNLGVSQNVIIGGGLHVEGELTCNHITAPLEIQETEQVRLFSKLLRNLTFKCNIDNGSHTDAALASDNHPHWSGATVTLIADSNDSYVRAYDHSHQFMNVPLHLMKNSDEVRKVGKACEQPEKIASQPVENNHKGGGHLAKGEAIPE
jgi:hypothetical protein